VQTLSGDAPIQQLDSGDLYDAMATVNVDSCCFNSQDNLPL
jgi:hypothetical protein